MDNKQRWNQIYQSGETFGTPEIVFGLLENLPSGSRVLDYGCGRGQNSIYMAKKGLYVVGFDISEKAVSQAKADAEKSGVGERARFFVSDGLSPSISTDAQFDGVVCTYVLDHFPPGLPEPIDPEVFESGLEHVKSLVRPGGLAAVSYAPKHIWPHTEKQEGMIIDRRYSEENFGQAFSDWEEIYWEVSQQGERQTMWGIKNNLDARILARRPLRGEVGE